MNSLHTRFFWLSAAVLTVSAYWLCLRFLFPGFFAPIAPFHVDFYLYAGTAAKNYLALALQYPRPVAYLGLKLLASGGLTDLMAGGIAIVLINTLLTLLLVIRIFRSYSFWMLVPYAVYLLLLFSHPQFYIEHRHDLPLAVSWFFLNISLLAWLAAAEGPKIRPIPLVTAMASAALFAFAKETYFVSALCIVMGLAIAYRDQRRRHLGFLVFLILIEFASVEWTNHFKGPFVNVSADPTATYYISLAPAELMQTYLFYLVHLLNPALILFAVLALVSAWGNRSRFILAATLVVAGLAAFATLAVLPNHKFEEYAWAGAPFFLAPCLLFGPSAVIRGWKVPLWPFLAVLFVFAFVGPGSYGRKYDNAEGRWWIGRDQQSSRLAGSFDQFQAVPHPARILVAGLDDATVPWQVEDFVALRFGKQLSWTVAFPPSVTYRQNSPLANFIDPAQVRLSNYDYVASYHANGELAGIRRADSIPAGSDLARVLVPDLNNLIDQADGAPENDYGPLLQCASMSIDWGFWPEAEEFLKRAAARISDPSSEKTFQRLQAAVSAQRQKQIEAPLLSKLEFRAQPQHIVQPDHSGLGVTELFWKVDDGVKIEIHVNSPNGQLFAVGEKTGHAPTAKWVTNGMKFFLQNVTNGKPLTAENTLAIVTMEVE
jgi:hypothetical protein